MIIDQNCNAELEGLFNKFENNKKPIEVNFRELVDWIPYKNRVSHFIHPYPAKLLMHIPHFFLNNTILSKKNDFVLDPFCGSGTTLLESALSCRNSVGFDVNPLAVLISKVKTTKLNIDELNNSIKLIREKLKLKDSFDMPNVVNLEYWFLKKTVNELSSIKMLIDEVTDDQIKNFFQLCFSAVVQKKSLSDPRVSVPVKLNPKKETKSSKQKEYERKKLEEIKSKDTFDLFFEIIERSKSQLEILNFEVDESIQTKSILKNSRNISHNVLHEYNEKFQLIITSPPYAGAQKYIRSSSLSMGWLGYLSEYDLTSYKKRSIGRERYSKYEIKSLKATGIVEADKFINEINNINPNRAKIVSSYLNEMNESFNEMNFMIKPGGFLVLVMGNNRICNRDFDTQKYVSQIAENNGFKKKLSLIDHIKSRGLMTKRNKTASVITSEWVHIFEK